MVLCIFLADKVLEHMWPREHRTEGIPALHVTHGNKFSILLLLVTTAVELLSYSKSQSWLRRITDINSTVAAVITKKYPQPASVAPT